MESSLFIEDILVGQLTDAQWRDQSVEIIKPDTFKRAWHTLRMWMMSSGALSFTSHSSVCEKKKKWFKTEELSTAESFYILLTVSRWNAEVQTETARGQTKRVSIYLQRIGLLLHTHIFAQTHYSLKTVLIFLSWISSSGMLYEISTESRHHQSCWVGTFC